MSIDSNEELVFDPSITEVEIDAGVHVLQAWFGLRDRNLDEHAIIHRILSAAKKASRLAKLEEENNYERAKAMVYSNHMRRLIKS